jgi:hypothetical protein
MYCRVSDVSKLVSVVFKVRLIAGLDDDAEPQPPNCANACLSSKMNTRRFRW